jgi:Recombinase zinc beta ribbon domain
MFSGLFRCAVCNGHYVIKSRKYYGCATNLNQGPSVCPNVRLVRRDVLETTLMQLIEHEVFSPEAVEHLTNRVGDALSRPRASRQSAVKRDLDKARQELENYQVCDTPGLDHSHHEGDA